MSEIIAKSKGFEIRLESYMGMPILDIIEAPIQKGGLPTLTHIPLAEAKELLKGLIDKQASILNA